MSGSRSRTPRISVPLPAPDGPEMTNRIAIARALPALPAQQRDELGPLALGEAADRLRLRDAAGGEEAAGLHAAALRYREQEVEHLRRQHPLRRVGQQRRDGRGAGLQIALQLRPRDPNDIRALQRLHPLVEAPCGCLGGELLRGRHGTRMIADLGPRRKAEPPVFLRETATSGHVNGDVFQIPSRGSDKALFGVMTRTFETGKRTGQSVPWATK